MSQQVVLAERALTVFTDGSAVARPRRGGIGIRFVHTDAVGEETVHDLMEPGFTQETVNRMELKAVIVALKTIDKGRLPKHFLDDIRRVDIYTDSMYVAENLHNALFVWPTNRWTTREGAPVLNADLWKELTREYMRLTHRFRVELSWRKGHSSSNPHNKAADKLARQSASRPFGSTRVAPAVRRKKSTQLTRPGSVGMHGQKLTIRIIESEYLATQRIYRYRYEVVSRRSPFRGCVDFAFSDDPILAAGHTYFVTMGREQGNPRIVKRHREIETNAQTSDDSASSIAEL